MNWQRLTRRKAVRPAIGAVLTVLWGLFLWKSSLGTPLINSSYDALFLFSSRMVTNKIAFVMMDNESYDALHQTRGEPWDRSLHAQLLNKLADDNCGLVVMDTFFGRQRDLKKDESLARAMQRHNQIVLMAEQALVSHSAVTGARPVPPAEPFYSAARKNWGVAWLDPDPDGIVRHHWPFPAPGPYPSLAETAARSIGTTFDTLPQERWIRYYGQETPWTELSYTVALKQPPGFFRNQIVFIGSAPKTSVPDREPDEFQTPYSRWTGEATAGTELMITSFVNLVNHEFLRRSTRLEACVLLFSGLFIGFWISRLRVAAAVLSAVALAIGIAVCCVGLSALTNFWFPSLLIIAGQIPVALVCAIAGSRADRTATAVTTSAPKFEPAPPIRGYRVVEPPFGGGAYGNVWLARNSRDEWRAIKVVALNKFDNDRDPYDREYDGVSRYREICDRHPGLLRVEFVSEKMPTHFYYVMELGDALDPGWQKCLGNYKPRDLNRIRSSAPKKRFPISECIGIGMELSDTLDFIHRSGLTHRDIKPENVLFVNGKPKLADVGLVTYIRPADQERTAVGTPGYMPPLPESPGTPQADIYALGMLLYVLSTGQKPAFFPEVSATLLGDENPSEFFFLNGVVLQACHPDPKERYASAREMYCDLERVHRQLSGSDFSLRQ